MRQRETTTMLATPDPTPLEGLLEPESFLPSQLAPARRDSLLSGERALMLAVLEDAIRCLEAPRGDVAREALDWILATDDEWPFSFVNICETLGIEPARLRSAIAGGRVRYALHLRSKPRPNRMRGRRQRTRLETPRLAAVG